MKALGQAAAAKAGQRNGRKRLHQPQISIGPPGQTRIPYSPNQRASYRTQARYGVASLGLKPGGLAVEST
jgi:hypothetical protein